jgi:tetratricopeptide (TPR) repeat protein
MDGRMSVLALLGLSLVCGGCVTSHEKTVALRDQSEATPANPKLDGKKPVPQRLLLAFADMKERDADTAKEPDTQARLRDEARRGYQEMLKAEPDNIEAQRGLARVYTRMGDYERAMETFNKALAKHPKDVNLWYDLGMLHNRRKEWTEGVRCFNKALEIDPQNQRCLKAMGFTLARAGQVEQSITYLTRAMGSSAAARYHAARMLLHLGEQDPTEQAVRTEQARQQLRMAVRENPNDERARELLANLESPRTSATPGGTPGGTPGTVEMQFAAPGH